MAKTLTIYRVEHPATEMGPWQSVRAQNQVTAKVREEITLAHCALSDFFCDNDNGWRSHPNIWDDFSGKCGTAGVISLTDNGWVCGVTTRRKLRHWFAAVANILLDCNFTVVAYTVNDDDVIRSHSGKQVMFLPSAAIDKEDLTILTLVE